MREDDRTVPTSPYGSSKLMTEIMLRDTGKAHGLRHGAATLMLADGAPMEVIAAQLLIDGATREASISYTVRTVYSSEPVSGEITSP